MDKIGPSNADYLRNVSAPQAQTGKEIREKAQSEGMEPLDLVNLKGLKGKEKIELIIQADSPASIEKLKNTLIEENPKNRIKADLPLINGFSIEIDQNSVGILPELSKISGDDVRVFLDGRISIPDPSIEKPKKPGEVSALLDVATKTLNMDKVWEKGFTGKDVVICVIDTGIAQHPDLKNKIIAFQDMVNGKTEAYDDQGHGTHCSSIAAGTGEASENAKFKGAAPDAKLIGVKVLDGNGSGSFTDVIKGIQWAVENKDKYGIKVISMSLGGPASESYKKDPVAQAVEKAVEMGIITVVAAGNSGPGKSTIGTPATAEHVITVGALDDKGTLKRDDDTVAYFSSRGPTKIDKLIKPDVLTPGVNITAADAHGTGYVSMSGTSMATPLAAGILACMVQAKPDVKPEEIKSLAKTTADKLADPKVDDNTQGAGVMDPLEMLNSLVPPEPQKP